jgi:transposase
MRQLYTLIAGTDPRQLEFAFALWIRDMVRTLIRREFRVPLSPVSVGRLLRTLGLSPQRPLWRA